MKYLKKFNESINSEIQKDLIEICYDITDDGKFEVILSEKDEEGYIEIRKHNYVSFDFNEIKEVCLRIKDYLGDNYEGFSDTGFEYKDLTDNLEIKNIHIVYIDYKYETS